MLRVLGNETTVIARTSAVARVERRLVMTWIAELPLLFAMMCVAAFGSELPIWLRYVAALSPIPTLLVCFIDVRRRRWWS